MATGPLRAATKQVERLFTTGGVTGLSEGQLLDRFVTRRDDAAFEALVARYGPMVLGICRRLLRDPNDVDDAFQATFLVLVRKAGTLRRRELMGNWLYGVASRVALRARLVASRRSAREGSGVEELPSLDRAEPGRELHGWLHEEIARLPEKYRAPVVLCYLEGLTHDEAAEQLHWPVGTVKGRLSRARDLLRSQLTRRGLTAAGAVTLLAELPRDALAAVPAPLFESTLRIASGPVSGLVAGPVLALTEGVVHTMFLAKLKPIGIVLFVAVGVVATSAAVSAYQGPEGRNNTLVAADPPAKPGLSKDYGKAAVQPGAAGLMASMGVAPSVPATVNDLMNAEKATFDTLVSRNGPGAMTGSVTGIMALHEWSQRTLQAHLDASQDPATRNAALAAHVDRMQALAGAAEALQGRNAVNADIVAVARTYALEARYRLASAQQTPPGLPAPAKNSGPGGGGVGQTTTQQEAAKQREAARQSQVRRTIASLSTRFHDSSPTGKTILKKLDEPISMSFANETPLEDVLKYIKSATQGPNDIGIAIYVDPDGLAQAEKTMQSPVALDLEGVPLKVTLRLLLRQLGLAYCVKDGLLMISSPEVIAEELEETQELLDGAGPAAGRGIQ